MTFARKRAWQKDEASLMAGSVRKILAYLGLADDESNFYDDLDRRANPRGSSAQDRYDDDYEPEPRRSRQMRSTRTESRRDDYDDEPVRQPNLRPVPSRPLGGSAQVSQPQVRRPAVRITQAPPKETTSEVITVAPRTFSDAQEIADHLRANRPVIVNIEAAPEDLRRRMTDFCSGVAYALGCKIERVATQILLFTPNNVTVRPEDRGHGRYDG